MDELRVATDAADLMQRRAVCILDCTTGSRQLHNNRVFAHECSVAWQVNASGDLVFVTEEKIVVPEKYSHAHTRMHKPAGLFFALPIK